MKILILSVSAGGGHIHAAEAIKKYILLNDSKSKVEVVDTLKFINPIIDKLVIGSYLKTLKVSPSLFGKLYNFSETDDNLATFSNKFNEILAKKILPLINNFEPDLIITTHPFPCEMVTILKRKSEISVPIVSVLTDYAPHSFWIHKGVDAYVVSNNDMLEEMVTRGVDRNLIHDLGIPVLPDFINYYDRTETLNELNLNPETSTILIMGGSLGIGKIIDIYEELTKIKTKIQVIVITGNNKKLYCELKSLENTTSTPTRILGYTEEVTKYMQSCDLLLTKPGGLTITEALICKTPIAIFCPIPGQEEKNAEFLIKHKLAIHLNNGENCGGIVEDLITHKDKLNEMKKNCELFAKPCSGNDIYKLLESFIKQKESNIVP